MVLSLLTGSSVQEQLVQPPVVVSFQEVSKHMWEEAEGSMNCSGNLLAVISVLGFPKLSSSQECAA